MIDALQPPGSSTAGPSAIGGVGLAGARNVAAPGSGEAGVDFGAMLTRLAADAAGTVRNAEALSIAGIQGRATVQQVVEAVMNAEQTLQGAIAIRDKVVGAYLELSRMQI
jgi:flagellar hook-basal body complex protein FliE